MKFFFGNWQFVLAVLTLNIEEERNVFENFSDCFRSWKMSWSRGIYLSLQGVKWVSG